MKNIIKKIGEKIGQLKNSSKDEVKETVIAGKIFIDLLKGNELSSDEISFLKSQSKDIVKIFGVLGMASISMSLTYLLRQLLLRKYGVNIFPSKSEIPVERKPLNESSVSDYFLILDDQGHDERHPSLMFKDHSKFVIATNVEEFKSIINNLGVPSFLTLDHDLGEDETAMEAIKWLVYEKEADTRGMKVKAHSANIQTRDAMIGLIKNWNKELDRRDKELTKEIRSIIRESIIEEETKRIKMVIDIPSELKNISSVFKKNGHDLYVVGGAVRDAVLGKKPKDFDLATDALPEKTIEILSKAGYNADYVGKKFGVVLLKTEDGDFEIASFREDVGSDGRRPDSVNYTTIDKDVKRRDLTINALFYDIDSSEVVDMVGGVEDARNGIVRAVGDPSERFAEDELRILRAIRFAGRFGHDIHHTMDDALKANSSLDRISPERIRGEFINGILTSKSKGHYLSMLEKYGLFKYIFNDLNVNLNDVKDSMEEYISIIAVILSRNDKSKVENVLAERKYAKNEIGAISFLIDLDKMIYKSPLSAKKTQSRYSVTDKMISDFSQSLGYDRGLRMFIEYKPSILPADLIKKGMRPGAELGNEVDRLEREIFLSLFK